MNTQETTALSPRETANIIKHGLQALAATLSGHIEPVQAVGIFSQLKQLEDVIEEMSKLTRARLLAYVQEEGVSISENGSLKAQFGEYEIEATVRNTGFDPAKVQALLRGKGMDVTAGCDQQITYKPNADKLHALVEMKRIASTELAACRFDKQFNLKRPVRVVQEESSDE